MSNFNLGTASGRIVVDGSGASAGFNVAQSAANAFLNTVQNKVQAVRDLGTRLTKVGVTGVAGFGVAVQAASKFEQQMSYVESVSGATTDEMEKLRKKAMDLGKSTVYSATEAGGAMEELIKAGLSVDDVLNGAADATVALAAAGGVELPEAATIAANAMNQFGLSAKEMPKIADLIAGAANASAIDVGDFGFSLSQAGAVANLTGLKFDDLAVAIAEMGNAGIKGSDAGTSIKTFLTNLIPTTDQQISKFEELGLTIVGNEKALKSLSDKGIKPASNSYKDVTKALEKYVDQQGGAEYGSKKNAKEARALGAELGALQNAFFKSNGEAKSMRDIQEVLHKATKDLTKEQKLATLEILFGSDAIRAAAVLADEGGKGYDKMSKAMGKVKAADVAATRLNNLSGSVEEMGGAFDTAKIIIGNAFLPIVRKLVDGVTTVINAFNNLSPGVQSAIIAVVGVGTAMSLLIGIAIKLAFILGPLLLKFMGMRAIRGVFSIFSAGFAVWRSGAGAAAALSAAGTRAALVYSRVTLAVQRFIVWGRRFVVLSRVMGAAWAFITGPIGLAIAAVLLIGFILYKTFEPFRGIIDGIGRAIKENFLKGLELLKAGLNSLVEGFNGAKEGGGGFLGFMQSVGNAARTVWEQLKTLAAWFMSNLMPVLREAGAMLKSALGDALVRIKDVVSTTLMPALQRVGETFRNDLLPALQQLGEKLAPLLPILKYIGIVIGGVIVGAILAFGYALATVIPPLIAFGAVVIETIINTVVTAFETLVAVVSGVLDIIMGIVRFWIAVFKGDWQGAWDAIKDIVGSTWDTIVALFTGAYKTITGIVSGLIDAVIKFFTTLWDVLVGHSIVPDMVTAIIMWIAKLPVQILKLIAGLVSGAITWFLNMHNKLIAQVAKLVIAVVNWFKGLPGKVKSSLSSLASSLYNLGITWGAKMLSAVVSKFGSVVKWFRGLPGRIRSAVGSLGSILYNAGRNIISGLLSGISSMIGSLQSKLSSVTNMIPDWKGPARVDAKLLTGNGKLIMEGLIKGIIGEEDALIAALRSLTLAIPAAVGGAYSGIPVSVSQATSERATFVAPEPSRTFVTEIHNPVAEKASDSVAGRLRNLAAAGVI